MNILIVAATAQEIAPAIQAFPFTTKGDLKRQIQKHLTVDYLITGPGIAATAYYMGKYLTSNYSFAINVGLTGSFDRDNKVGDVVEIVKDTFSELGAEDDENFLTMNEIGLACDTEIQNTKYKIRNGVIDQLKKANGITVSTVHGNESSIKKVVEKFNPAVESMEGAAFMYACEKEKILYAQVRAISNYVEKRNKNNWNIPLAIKNLNDTLLEIIKHT